MSYRVRGRLPVTAEGGLGINGDGTGTSAGVCKLKHNNGKTQHQTQENRKERRNLNKDNSGKCNI